MPDRDHLEPAEVTLGEILHFIACSAVVFEQPEPLPVDWNLDCEALI